MKIIKVKYGKNHSYADVAGFVYCGRCFGGFEASCLGNPFKVGKDGTLQEVLSKYLVWLLERHRGDEQVKLVLSTLTRDSVLGCWCCNKPVAGSLPWKCHCDVVATVWHYLYERR